MGKQFDQKRFFPYSQFYEYNLFLFWKNLLV